MNDTVEMVARVLPELRSPSSDGLQTSLPPVFWQADDPLMLLAFEMASSPVIEPAMTPAPASPKPPKIRSLLPPEDSVGASGGVVGSSVFASGGGADCAGSSMETSFESFSARSISCLPSAVPAFAVIT